MIIRFIKYHILKLKKSISYMGHTRKENPFISVITPVKNGAETIKKTIDSIREQSFKDFEYIVIDSKSNDDTEQIIMDNKDLVDVYVRENDEGIYDAMNKGIELAKGEYISIINSDDYLNINAFQEVYNHSLLDNNVVFYSDMIIFNNYTKKRIINQGKISKDSIYKSTLEINHPTVFIPKSIYKKYGLFDKQFRFSADRELIMRLLFKKVKFKKLNTVLALFSLGGLTSKYSLQIVIEESFSEYKLLNRYTNKKTALIFSIITFLRLFRNLFLYKLLPKELFLNLRLLKIS